MEFSHYEEVPANIAEEIIKQEVKKPETSGNRHSTQASHQREAMAKEKFERTSRT
jgi:hypothetical protein